MSAYDTDLKTSDLSKPSSTLGLSLGAAGIVFGDIGTSPIYALRETVSVVSEGGVPTDADIIGSLSVITWALTFVVAIKYALFVLRADNHGEGGTLAIMALARKVYPRWRMLILGAGMVGATLFLGDALITPAISVLSAVEGLEVAAPALGDYVPALALGLLVGLFSIQKFGTGAVSAVFGPVMLVWFVVLAVTGIINLANEPHVLAALNPYEAVAFVARHPEMSFLIVGASFLAVTGAEALYVDIGHFGRRPIHLVWFVLVFPALLINYYGQGAFLITVQREVGSPLFEMVPQSLSLALVFLATLATIIASQAVISGAFSLVRQAIQLQLLPRMTVLHTSASQSGQIYIPVLNWLLAVGVILLVVGFQSSAEMASAYGIAISGEMAVTTVLLGIVMLKKWHWRLELVVAIVLIFLLVDLAFLASNMSKTLDGGWVSLLIGLALLILMRTWRRGTLELRDRTRRQELTFSSLQSSLSRRPPHTVEGTAVFLTSDPELAPTALLHSLKHYKVLHQQNVILTVETAQRPRLGEDERVIIEQVGEGFVRVRMRFGFMEDPNVPRGLGVCRKHGLKFEAMSTSFFLSRRVLVEAQKSDLPRWQRRLFIWLARNATDATSYFRLPTGRVVEIGTMVQL